MQQSMYLNATDWTLSFAKILLKL